MTRAGTAKTYWDDAATTYDCDFTDTLTGRARRRAVWRTLDRTFQPGPHRVLELNCGTGIDAVHLAGRGIRVLACDISPRMVELARRLAEDANVSNLVEFRVLENENIGTLASEGPFDGGFSSFSGLNCVEDLAAVARALATLLPMGTRFIAGMTGRFVPWELAWFLAHGRPAKALRRLRRDSPEFGSGPVKVRQYQVTEIAAAFAPDFELRRWEGLGIAVPPSYMEKWARRFPRATEALAVIDGRIGRLPVFRSMADGVLLEFERG
jgi:SAM-dependent methyltransferase